jgi:hypothetical protein
LSSLDDMVPSTVITRMRKDVEEIIRELSEENRERLRRTSEDDLILFHHGFGTGLRNALRQNRFPGLSAYCHDVVKRSGESLSFDAISTVAIRQMEYASEGDMTSVISLPRESSRRCSLRLAGLFPFL